MDTETGNRQIEPGRVVDGLNFEGRAGGTGYDGLLGYEAFDGQMAPSKAQYWIMDLSSITATINDGDVIVGATSGATAVVVEQTIDPSLILTELTGTFETSETLEVSSTPVAVGGNPQASSATGDLHLLYRKRAADHYRAKILAVPGEGRVLGVAWIQDTWYAWRNKVGGAEAGMYKATGAGWVEIKMPLVVPFYGGGTYEPQPGDIIRNNIAGSLGIRFIARLIGVIVTSGSWAGTDAAGFMLFDPDSVSPGGHYTGTSTLSTIFDSTVAFTQGADTHYTFTLLPNGRYQTVRHNFGGQEGTERLYGCDGVNPAFEFDPREGGFYQISTGMTVDKPTNVAVFQNHLFLSFDASLQHSSIGDPLTWSVVTGAGELATGSVITSLQVQPGDAAAGSLIIGSRRNVHVLYGSDVNNWNLVRYREEIGALPYTIQDVGFTVALDNTGLVNFRTTQAFGNFIHAFLTERIKSWIQQRALSATASCIVRSKSQYRVFFANGQGLVVTLSGNGVKDMFPLAFEDPVLCCESIENSQGIEEIMFGSNDGFVYQMERGVACDDAAMLRELSFPFLHAGSPDWLKRWQRILLDIGTSEYLEFTFRYELGYGSDDLGQPVDETVIVAPTFHVWDETTQWGDGRRWGGHGLRTTKIPLAGTGENLRWSLSMSSDRHTVPRLEAFDLAFKPRRRLRA